MGDFTRNRIDTMTRWMKKWLLPVGLMLACSAHALTAE